MHWSTVFVRSTMSSSQNCLQAGDLFCDFWGIYTGTMQVKQGINVSTKFALTYKLYFDMKFGDQGKSWTPNLVHGTCRSNLDGGMRGVCPPIFSTSSK